MNETTSKIQFLTEMYLVEVSAPGFSRPRQPNLFNVPLLSFGSEVVGE